MRKNWRVANLVATTLFAILLSEADNFVAARNSNSQIAKECPKRNPPSGAKHLPHEWDCTKFYTCDHGRRILFDCPVMDGDGNRLYYNAELEVCDWPENSGCVQETQPTTSTKSTAAESLATTLSTTRQSATWSEISTQPSSVRTTTTPPTTTEPTPMPTTTMKTTLVDTTTERLTTTSSPATIETSTDATTTPTTMKTTLADVTSQSPTTEPPSTSTETITETTNTPTTMKMTEPSTSAESSSTVENTTPVPTDNTEKPSTTKSPPMYIPHENNCSLFYEVIDHEKTIKECPPGLHFSPTFLTCMSPAAAGCESTTVPAETTTPTSTTCGIPCDGASHGSFVPHECLCEKYYRCSNGDLILHRCPSGLHFNPRIYSCDYPNSAGCMITTPEPATDKPSTSMTIPSECPPDNSGGTLQFPHPTNCSLFYKCDNGEKKLMQCPNSLHFNPSIQMCDWPDSAGCAATANPVSSSETPTETTAIHSETSTKGRSTDTTTVQIATTTLPTECPRDESGSLVQLPHPHNCSLYYVCDNGEKILQSCPPGLEFSPQERVCDWPELSGCTASTWSSEGTKKPTTTTEIVTNYTTASPTTIGIPTECPVNGSGRSVHLPHPYDCSLYYNCENGKKIVQSCPPGLEFNAREQVCDWPNIAGCVVSTTETSWTTAKWTTESVKPSTETPKLPNTTVELSTTTREGSTSVGSSTETTTSLKTSTEEITFLPTIVDSWDTDSETTESSKVSSSITIGETKPPKTTMEWITSSEASSVSSTSSETPSWTFDCPLDSNGLQLPHEANCSLYYECSEGSKILMECAPGLHFSPVLEICVWPEDAGCEASTISTDSPSSVTDDYVDQESSSSTDNIFSSTPIDSETADPDGTDCIGTCPSKDPSDRTILLPHKDCTKFCKCSNSKPYVYECPAELHFSPELFVCDYPKKAKCLGEGGTGTPKEELVEQYA